MGVPSVGALHWRECNFFFEYTPPSAICFFEYAGACARSLRVARGGGLKFQGGLAWAAGRPGGRAGGLVNFRLGRALQAPGLGVCESGVCRFLRTVEWAGS